MRRPFIGITAEREKEQCVLRDAYPEAFLRAGFDVCILSHADAPDGLVRRLDGIVFSGGDDIHPSFYREALQFDLTLIDDRRTEFEIALFRSCIAQDMPVLGICNGMQLMNVALGGTLFQDIGRQAERPLDHALGNHAIRILFDSFLTKGYYSVNSAHHQAIRERGTGVRVLATSDDGMVEAITVEGRRFALGVQWHPEREPDTGVNKALFSAFREACSAA